ncbi:hypothetical protein [Pontibacter chinhatensis]|uniref:Uncharacterized protein n=1 Tax=Pontibacter chinhatensis TaxID=1436961 RepID=A0A1I2QVQ2_9BACT|nr:hypothetical protein [Pontibacter chinhatensis]SFG29716.1 hypothetical protein SAMN05421739_10259 [Pontibacter chinhatensis]
MTLENITNHINANAAAITENLAHESIEVHKYLMQKFSRTNAAEDLLFQFLYRSFYRLDNAGLTAEFKTAYFNIFEEERANQHPNIKAILQKLRNFKNKKGQENVQFSFATKLANTINNSYPIYDSEVARVFGYSRPLDKDFDKKVDKYLLQFQHIREAYDKILAENLLKPTIELFNNRFQGHSLPEMKRLDFIFWSAGKLLKKEVATRKEPQQLDLASA